MRGDVRVACQISPPLRALHRYLPRDLLSAEHREDIPLVQVIADIRVLDIGKVKLLSRVESHLEDRNRHALSVLDHLVELCLLPGIHRIRLKPQSHGDVLCPLASVINSPHGTDKQCAQQHNKYHLFAFQSSVGSSILFRIPVTTADLCISSNSPIRRWHSTSCATVLMSSGTTKSRPCTSA